MAMEIVIRQEVRNDYNTVEDVVRLAFAEAEHTNGDEHHLVARLRQSEAFIPELSLVALVDGKIVGHILFTKAVIKNGEERYPSLSIAPLSVLPKYQGKGIGSSLMIAGMKKAAELGYRSVVLVGHPGYYPRFGFKRASQWGIKLPFAVPDEAFMACPLVPEGLSGVSGWVEHAKEFLLEE